MPKRERNWKPDIYDLTHDRPAAEPQLDIQDMAEEDVVAPQLDVRDMAEEDVVAPLAASAERAVVGTEQAVVAEMRAYADAAKSGHIEIPQSWTSYG